MLYPLSYEAGDAFEYLTANPAVRRAGRDRPIFGKWRFSTFSVSVLRRLRSANVIARR